ncbi:uncharacterized protein LOC122004709 [Zingiber officinale]|uniref:uncharacterized protein LOC122004709 n=1 Tax=Zingiber officinale TaxID=94328 RepID=UPI001C4AFB68|nr:uncharacterized protein LOC122004709 [Zingiber officinale]
MVYELYRRNGWVVYRFDTKEDSEKVLKGGPYFIFGIPIFLKIMPKHFLFNEDCRFVPAWIQIHGLPPDCWTQKVLSMVGSEVGKSLYTDNLTRTRDCLEYARLLVEIPTIGERVYEVPITLPTEVQVDLRIVYESLPDFCEVCKRLGHRLDTCRRSDASVGQQTNRSRDNMQNGIDEQRQWRARSQSTKGRGRTRMKQQWRPAQQKQNMETPGTKAHDVVTPEEVQNVDQIGNVAIDVVAKHVDQNGSVDVNVAAQVEVQIVDQHDNVVAVQDVDKNVRKYADHLGVKAKRTIEKERQQNAILSAHSSLGNSSSSSLSAEQNNTASSETINTTSTASTSSLPLTTSSSVGGTAGVTVPALSCGRQLRARVARKGDQ